jgi:squalene synthase HpnC
VSEDEHLAAAYVSCARDGRRHYENFPVASLLLPRAMRPHVAAVYAFARAADDFADEGALPANRRLDLLDGWLERLRRAASGSSPDPEIRPGEPSHAPAIFLALGASIDRCSLPTGLLEDLISAFRQDVTVTRYATWTDLLDYCRRSANPVGRLVLRIAGYEDSRMDAWSDAICTGLQLTNFWQDFRIDHGRGRIYLPREEQRTHGAREEELSPVAGLPPAWTKALRAAVGGTRQLFDGGRPLCDHVDGRLKYELRTTWLGGIRILDRLAVSRFDAAGDRPTITVVDAPWFLWKLLTWTGSRTPLAYRPS